MCCNWPSSASDSIQEIWKSYSMISTRARAAAYLLICMCPFLTKYTYRYVWALVSIVSHASLMVSIMRWISLVAALHENVAWYKLPIGDGREVLTSAAHLKYFHKASHSVYPPRVHVEQKISNRYIYRKLQGYLISRFNKYP